MMLIIYWTVKVSVRDYTGTNHYEMQLPIMEYGSLYYIMMVAFQFWRVNNRMSANFLYMCHVREVRCRNGHDITNLCRPDPRCY